MLNNKTLRINGDITRTLASLLREVKDPRLNAAMLTVVRTETTSDLKFCKVYISALGQTEPKEIKRGLKSASGFLRGGLSRGLNLRNTPELTFILDDSIAHSVKITNVLKDLSENETTTETTGEPADD